MYLAIDVGGTSIKSAIFKSLTPESIVETVISPTKNDYAQDLGNIFNLIAKYAAELTAVGIGIPGIVNEEEGVCLVASNISDWKNRRIVSDINQKFPNLKVFISSDSACTAMGEAAFSEDKLDFNYIVWGTGIGGAAVTFNNNNPIFQHLEIGFQIVDNDYLENHCGGKMLTEKYHKPVAELSENEWDEVLEHMSIGIVNLLALNYKPRLVFAGGVAIKQKARLPKLMDLVKKKSDFYLAKDWKVSQFGENAGMIGALGLIKLRLNL